MPAPMTSTPAVVVPLILALPVMVTSPFTVTSPSMVTPPGAVSVTMPPPGRVAVRLWLAWS
ncbi:hypothetical protein D3C85_1942260 [compost metagenome]